MRIIKTTFEAFLVFLIFIGCTLIFYYGILWISEEYKNYHRYEEPKGKAVKVVQHVDDENAFQLSLARLHLFLINGE